MADINTVNYMLGVRIEPSPSLSPPFEPANYKLHLIVYGFIWFISLSSYLNDMSNITENTDFFCLRVIGLRI